MWYRFLEVREKLQVSIWLIPTVLCMASLGLALALIWAERELSWLIVISKPFAMEVVSAREVMGVIAGAVLGVGGVVFSVTMVALTLTSGQYGPKILRQFLGDNGSKISLGMFLGTSLYCLILLARYEHTDQPAITVIGALLLTAAALAGFISFIHNTATDLQADQIIQRIGGDLQSSLADLVDSKNEVERQRDTLIWRRKARGRKSTLIGATADGYVQTVDYPVIVAWCRDHNCLGQLRVRPGDFILPGNWLIKLYGFDGETSGKALSLLRSAVRTGPMRNPIQDPEFPITQLNQLAARALSPGLNDPGTAITCVDWFSTAVAQIVDCELPGKVFLDKEHEPRLLARCTDFPGILKAFYAPSRQFALSNFPVLIALVDSLIKLAEVTTIKQRLACIEHQGQLLSQAVESEGFMNEDLVDFRQRYKKLLRVTSRLKAHGGQEPYS